MDHDYAQRRRVALALAITVIAAPAAFLLNRSNGDDEPATAGDARNRWSARSRPAGGTRRPRARRSPSHLTTPTRSARRPPATSSGTTVPGDVVAGPDRRAAPARVGQGTRHVQQRDRLDPAVPRQRREVPFNATITVTNLDNSRSVQCVSSIGGAQPETTIVLATATFAQIADLTDAPVPVQITWNSD